MNRKCIALLSGGLDSMLAIRLMQQQNVAVEAVNFKTIFTCCQDQAGRAARELGVPVTVVPQEDDYLDLIRQPSFGYGKGANPCVDCRIYMFERARRFMEQVGADFIVSGEVIGQRPMSQKKRDLHTIAHHSRLDDLLLRPLSAKQLPPTLPERKHWVDRKRLYGFYGRNRKGLIQLARELGLVHIPTPSTGCALTEPQFARKVFDLMQSPGPQERWDFELLKLGRHFRLNANTKVVIGRHEAENEQLKDAYASSKSRGSAVASPENFRGPRALILGSVTEQTTAFACGLILRYSRHSPGDDEPLIRLEHQSSSRVVVARQYEKAAHARTIAEGPDRNGEGSNAECGVANAE